VSAIIPSSVQLAVTSTGQLVASSPIDFESLGSTKHQINATVTVTDNGAPLKSASALVTINVEDVDEPPTFERFDYVCYIAENSPPGTVAKITANDMTSADCKVSASDQDAETIVAYQLVGKDSTFSFSIDESTGLIKVSQASGTFDYESALNSFVFDVGTKDISFPSVSTRITVFVTNVNEAPSLSPRNFTVGENAYDDYTLSQFIGSPFIAADPDAGDIKSLVYTITSILPDSNAFELRPSLNGFVQLALNKNKVRPSSFTKGTVYTIVVNVKDSLSASADATIRVTVGDVNYAPTLTDVTFQTKEDAAKGM
jgi:hypothetical protein